MAKTNNELVEVARAALEYIDALPNEVVASLPVMPGFDRDWAENTLTFFSNPCSEQESAFYVGFDRCQDENVLENVNLSLQPDVKAAMEKIAGALGANVRDKFEPYLDVPREVLEQVITPLIPPSTRSVVDMSGVELPERLLLNQGRSSAPDFIIYECDDCGALSVDEHESTCHCMGPKRTWTAIPVSKVSGGKDE